MEYFNTLLAQKNRRAMAIDFYPRGKDESRREYPDLFQWILERVKPERDHNPVAERRNNWWLFTRPIPVLRQALRFIPRYLVVPRTAKHFAFQFISAEAIPDTSVVAIASPDAFLLGLLSSRCHNVWAITVGGRLGVGNDTRYQHNMTFKPFPFPASSGELNDRISRLAEQLDAHRKRQQQSHPDLTMTGMYNVLEKLRSGEPLTKKEQVIHEQGLVSVLKQIHDELDAAVFEAYGWPVTLTDEEILERLVALNHERAEEEKRGLVRWLRPEFQNPGGDGKRQQRLAVEEPDDDEEPPVKGRKGASLKGKVGNVRTGSKLASGTPPVKKRAWPAKLAERIKAVRSALVAAGKPASVDEIAGQFVRPKKEQVGEVLEVLLEVGQARLVGKSRFVA